MTRYVNWFIDPELVSAVRHDVSQWESKCHIHNVGISPNLLSEIHHAGFCVKCYMSFRCVPRNLAVVYIWASVCQVWKQVSIFFTPQGPVPFIDRFMDQRFQFLTDNVPHRLSNMSVWFLFYCCCTVTYRETNGPQNNCNYRFREQSGP